MLGFIIVTLSLIFAFQLLSELNVFGFKASEYKRLIVECISGACSGIVYCW